MPCTQWNDEWVAHLYGEVEPAERQAIDRHLAGCAACRATLSELQSSRDSLRGAAPEIAVEPRVLVLRPPPLASRGWAFAAGAACALLLFGAGFVAGPRWTNRTNSAGSGPPQGGIEDAVAARAAEAALPADFTPVRDLRDALDTLEQRLTRIEGRNEGDPAVTQQCREAVGELERRVNRERARDLEYVVRSLTASELRTGTWMDQAHEALTLLALRHETSVDEQ